MSVWRYTAIELSAGRSRKTGEMSGRCAADVRASLRRIGFQVIDLRQLRHPKATPTGTTSLGAEVQGAVHRYLRKRRQHERAELYDALATMLQSGVPLLESGEVVAASIRRRRSSLRAMLIDVDEELRAGSSLGQAMARHPGWFDTGEVAMVRAGHHSGTLPDVLRSLSERHERSINCV